MKRLIASVLSVLALAAPAWAQDYPSRPITIIVGVAPGGSLDALARLVGNALSGILKQSVVVENVTGAGGLLGFQRLMKSAPDGYTVMFSNNSMVLIPLLHPQSGIDVVADTAPVGTVANVPMVLSVSNKSAVPDLPTLLARMRSGELRPYLGSGGPGTTAHLAEAMFLRMAGAQGELVQYRGSGPALTDLMAGTIDAMIDQTVTMMPLHKDGRIKAIAVAAKERLPQMPDVPTFAEGGLAQFSLQIWNGLVAPKGTPEAVVDTLARALSEAVATPEFKARIEQLAAQIPPQQERSPAGFRRTLERDQQQLAELARQIGLPAR
ncbi:tripartite tricarboxylate transporter substrate binding protein [Orrella sp. JC864]|uniref:Bug family tripartite tricarboxylate transporter substrate binding protein n=1 Tax=Orrella sp. JC864 TaxID=3120298 RepID=UPI0030090106